MTTTDILRDLEIPQDLLAEKGLLSALCAGPGLCLEHQAILSQQLFNHPAHKIIFEALTALAQKNERIELFMLQMEVAKTPDQLDAIGGKAYLEEVWTTHAVAAAWDYYYPIALKVYRRREAVLAAKKIIESDDSDEQAAIADQALKSIAAPQKSQSVPFKERLVQTLEWIEKTTLERSPSLLKFGIPELDQMLYPVEGGNQIVIGAPTSGGKTALAAQAVLKSPGAAAIFSLEMDAKSLVVRMVAHESGVSLKRIRLGLLAEADFRKMTAAVELMKSRPIWIEDVSPIDVRSIAAKCRALKHQGLSIAVIDYLQLVTPANHGKRDLNREREVAEISRSLKSLAMELGIVTVALSQLNDDGQVRESRAIAQDADCVLCIATDEDRNPDEIIIQKQRNGARGRIPIAFDGDLMRFSPAHKQSDTAG